MGVNWVDKDWVNIIILSLLLIVIAINHFECRSKQRIIDRQNDTIQRLINREPVTYSETGQPPPKRSKEVYAAWGAQMVDLDRDIDDA